jgi:RHS repeat-associated protein
VPALRRPSARTYLTRRGEFVTVIAASSGSRLVPTAGGYASRASGFTAHLPSSLAQPVELRKGSDWISFSLAGARGSASVHSNRAVYRNALPGVDVRYAVLDHTLKESLVLRNAAAPTAFGYRIRTSRGLQLRPSDTGAIAVVTSAGKRLLSLAPPFMVDTSRGGGGSSRVATRLVQTAGGYTLRLRPSRRWLTAKARVYPVTIDPTVNLSPSPDCTIANGSLANTSFCADTTDQVGYNGANVYRSLFKFDTSSISKQAEVLTARLDLYLESETSTTQSTIDADQLTRTFTSAVTWNKYDGTNNWTTPGGDYVATPAATTTVGGTLGVYSWYLASLVDGWVHGSSANNGIILRAHDETVSNLLRFSSSETSTQNPPKLVVGWVDRTGLRHHFTTEDFPLTDRMDAHVNVANGNLTVHAKDLHIAGTAGHDVDLERYFNRLAFNPGYLGNNWTLSTGHSTQLQILEDGSAAYTGETGDVIPFRKRSDGSFTPPTGANATLVKNQDGTYKLTFNQTDLKQNFSVTNNIGLMTSEVDRNGNTISFSYASGLDRITDTQGRVTSLTTDASGRVTLITDPSGRTYRFAYDGSGNLTSYTDPANRLTTYTYDGSGNLTKIVDPAGKITTFAYDSSQRVTSVTRVTDPVALTGPTTAYTYSAADASCSGSAGKTVSTDPNGHQTTYCWDSTSRVTQITDALGHHHSATYDDNSDVTSDTDALNHTTSDSYDPSNNLTSVQLPTGAHMDYLYDRTGPHPYLPIAGIDPQGNRVDYTYDTPGNLIQKKEANGWDTVSFSYNSNGTLKDATDGRRTANSRCPNTAATYCYGYDTNGNRTSETPPAPLGVTTYTYDSLSRITSVTDGKNQTTSFTYDVFDRVTQAQFADGSTVTYQYDGDGNRTQRIDSSGTATYTYDALNRLTQQTLPSGTFTYGYDPANNLVSLTDSGGTVNYGYDAADELTTVTEPGGSQATFSYDANGNRTGTLYPNGVGLTMTHDSSQRLLSILSKKSFSGPPITYWTYSYQNGSSDSDLLQHATNVVTGVTTNYVYSLFNGLQSAIGGGQSYSYIYDANGNMTSKTVNGVTTNYTYDAANELSGSGYTFDANGNQTASPDVTSLVYNTKDQTTSMTPAGGSPISMTYSGMNQWERNAEGSSTFRNSGLGVTGIGSTSYTREPDGTLVDERNPAGGSGNYYYLFDGLDSVIGLTDSAGNLVDTYKYDPYGGDAGTTGSVVNPWRYRSGYWNSQLKLYKFGVRYYDPTRGRWTQTDPVDSPLARSGWSPYTYAGDDPNDSDDPSGMLHGAGEGSLCANEHGDAYKRCAYHKFPYRVYCSMWPRDPACTETGGESGLKKLWIAACSLRGGWAVSRAYLYKKGLVKAGSKLIPGIDVPCGAYMVYEGMKQLFGK